jgi:hypothetical protein
MGNFRDVIYFVFQNACAKQSRLILAKLLCCHLQVQNTLGLKQERELRPSLCTYKDAYLN